MTFRTAANTSAMVDYLREGYWGSSGERPFDMSADTVLTVNLTGLTAAGQRLARAALESWETVANITFREVTSGANIRFSDDGSGGWTSFTTRGGYTTGATVNVGLDWLRTYGEAIGSYSFFTYVHEIGHALGLGHPGNYNGDGVTWSSRWFQTDSWQYSAMSYFGQDENPYSGGASRGAPLTPQIADILAVQQLYGAPVAGPTAANTVWGKGSNLDTYLGRYFREVYVDNPDPSKPVYSVTFTIYDQGGTDTLDLSHSRRDQVINLAPGGISDVIGRTGNLMIAPGTLIEHARGGSGADRIQGNSQINHLTGGAGADQLFGMSGNDRLIGDAGNDRLDGGTGNDRLEGGLGHDTMTGGSGADRFVFTGGTDRIIDMTDADTIAFSRSLFGTGTITVADILDEAVLRSGRVVFDFGAQGTLTLDGITVISGLADDVLLA
jgi:serralysin